MAWFLNSTDGQQSYPISVGQTLHLVEGDTGLAAVHATPDDTSLILGTLAIQSYGAKLEAGSEDLRISPGGPNKLPQNGNGNSPDGGFVLQAKTDNRVETIILRNQDKISTANKSDALTFHWTSPLVQVHSSEKTSESPAVNGEAAEPEEETEDDDEDLDNTIVPGVSKPQQLRLTPHTSMSVIQETPTTNRIGDATALPSRTGPPGLIKEVSSATAVVYSTAPQRFDIAKPEEPADVEMENNEETPKKSEKVPHKPRHPQVKIPKSIKRPSPAVEEEPRSPSAHTTKRRKVEEDSESEAKPVQSARQSATKGKKQVYAAQNKVTPSRSQRSTQTSTTSSAAFEEEGEYDGPKPRVAFSNSSIQPTSNFAKFLKKNGGNIVDSVDGDYNIVCIKDGPVLKTPKVLQAVAQGIPIATDKWLIDSSKASRFLPFDRYIPATLAPVWKIPQDKLFKGYTIYFTPALKTHYKSSFSDMEKLCKAVGARRVVSKKPGGKDLTDDKSSIFLAEAEADKDVPGLLEAGHKCFTKDFLTHSIMVGEFDLKSEEFRLQQEDDKPAKKKGRARNS